MRNAVTTAPIVTRTTPRLIRAVRPSDSRPALLLHAAGATRRGSARDANQDGYALLKLERHARVEELALSDEQAPRLTDRESGLLAGIADGMGGHAHGGRASAHALRAVLERAAVVLPGRDDALAQRAVLGHLAAAFRDGDERVGELRADGAARMPGTTLTVAYIEATKLHLGHVGDSRCYLLRNGELRALTRDHTIGPTGAHPGALYNAIGGNDSHSEPDLFAIELEPTDRLLLTTDGVTNELDDAELAQTLLTTRDARQAAKRVIALVDEAKGRDDATAVAIYVDPAH